MEVEGDAASACEPNRKTLATAVDERTSIMGLLTISSS
jgi:hypothetical protein